MSNPTRKQAFAPAQAVAAVSALDFAATAEAFRVALAHDSASATDTEDLADMIAERADRVVSTPAHTPAQIAEKLTAYAWLHGLPHDLANPTTQAAIAAGNRDDAKGLLAIYLDLTGAPAGSYLPGSSHELDRLISNARSAVADFLAACDLTDEVKAENEGRVITAADQAHYDAKSDARDAAFDAVRAFPARSPELALVKQRALAELTYEFDHGDLAANIEAARADLVRLSQTPSVDRSEWEAAQERYEEAVRRADYNAFPRTNAGNADWEKANDERVAAFGALVRTPAPDAEANRVKLRAVLLEGHDESITQDEPDTPHGLQRMLTEGGVDESWPLVYVYQDAIRQAGDLTSPLLTPSRPTPSEEA